MAKLSAISRAKKKTEPSQGDVKALLGRWMHWAIMNGHVYKDDGLTEETVALLFGKPLDNKDLPKLRAHYAQIEKMLHQCAG